MKAFSLIEVLFALLIISVIMSSTLNTYVSFKKQNLSSLSYIHKHSSIIETQLFLNNYFFNLVPKSLKISQNIISWEGYEKLFLSKKSGMEHMDYSKIKSKYVLKLDNNNLTFNNNLLLKDVSSITFNLTTKNTLEILEYEICQQICINDFIILQDLVIKL